nr:peptidase inhibitor family I36 protein [Micromonospora sp. DSM 115978]
MRTPSNLRQTVAALATSFFFLAFAASPANATNSADVIGSDSPSVAIASLQELYSGSVIVASDTIKIRPGVFISLPADHDRATRVEPSGTHRLSSEELDLRSAEAPRAPHGTGKKKSPAPEYSTLADLYGCADLHLCLFSGQNFTGYKLSFYYCQFENLGYLAYPGGGYWNDKMSSWVNNQSYDTYSFFYNWNGVDDWLYVDYSIAVTAWGTPPYDNLVDGVHVC